MMTPNWILDVLAGVMLLVAVVSAARLAIGRPWRTGVMDADIDGAHLLMGIAMAGMLVASLTTLPNGAWDVIFALMTAWFGWVVYRESRGRGFRVAAESHHTPHLVHAAAMLYMFAAIAAPVAGHGPGMAGMAGGSTGMSTLNAPILAFLFALLLLGYSVVDLDRLPSPHAHGRVLAGPALATAGAGVGGGRAGGGPLGTAAAAPAPAGGGVATVPEQAAAAGPQDAHGGTDGPGGNQGVRWLLSNRTATGCRIAMGVTMAFMLVIMI
jgi:Domain of unknown function (DUF5134)